jgi:oligopeptidase B
MRKLLPLWTLLAILAGSWLVAAEGLNPQAAKPPVAKKVAKITTLHGDMRVDYYDWLRDKSDKEVIAYLDSENAYTAAVMKPTEVLQETLYKEMLGRIKQTDLSVPYRLGDYFYYTRTVQGKQYNIHCRKKGSLDAAEEIILDLNELVKGQKFLMLGPYDVSVDGNLLAFAIDVTGFREFNLFVKDLRTGRLLPDRIDKIVGVAWAADNETLFVIREDHAKRPFRLDRHVLGKDGEQPVYEEKDELYRLTVSGSRDKKYLFLVSGSSTTTEQRYLPSDQPAGEWRVILPREEGHRYIANHRDGVFYIRTNKDAKNYRLVTAPVADPAPKNWSEMIPHRPNVMLQNIDVFEHHAVVSERAKGLPGLKVIDLRDGASHAVDFPEPIYSAMGSANPEYKATQFRFNYQSLVTPNSVFDYDLDKRTRKLMKRTEVLGGYDPDEYASERCFATASDGAKIPISLVWKKGVKRDGTAPMLLYGYGAYGASLPIAFQSARLSLLDRGVVFAMAHVRGGGDMGEVWHDQGKMMEKRNSFTDFIAAADHLVAEKYSSRDRLVIQGASAGGLLMGGTLAIRPNVAKAVVLQVPFVDVINTMLDTSLPLTIQEFLEWGNPQIKKEYEYIKTYCPYTNLKPQQYPAMLLTTSLNDSQVMYFEPAKYTAKLRSLKTDNNVLLLKTNMAGGHGGFSGRYDALRDQAFVMAFVLKQMGMEK